MSEEKIGVTEEKKEASEEKKRKQELKKRIKEEFELLKKRLEEKTKESEEYKELAQRIKAEFDNYKKRVLKENEERIKVANENLIKNLLPILDTFELAINFKNNIEDEKFKNFYNGILMIYNNLKDVLGYFGLKEINIADNKFDPNYHEAVSIEESENCNQEIITEVFSKGYMLGDKILRHAKVKVLKPIIKNQTFQENSEQVSNSNDKEKKGEGQ